MHSDQGGMTVGVSRIGKLTTTLAAGAIAASAALSGAALAQSGNFALELNNASDTANGCRLTYVATNNTGTALTETSYEVAIFNGEGVVSRLLVLEFGELQLGKTKVVQFDLSDQGCADISRIIVNNVADCKSGDTDHDFCLTGLVTNSRNDIQFGI